MIFICRFDYYITPGYYFFDRSPGFALRFPLPHLYHKLVTQSFDTDTSEYLPCIKIFVYVELKKLKICASFTNCCFQILSIQTGEQSAMLWE